MSTHAWQIWRNTPRTASTTGSFTKKPGAKCFSGLPYAHKHNLSFHQCAHTSTCSPPERHAYIHLWRTYILRRQWPTYRPQQACRYIWGTRFLISPPLVKWIWPILVPAKWRPPRWLGTPVLLRCLSTLFGNLIRGSRRCVCMCVCKQSTFAYLQSMYACRHMLDPRLRPICSYMYVWFYIELCYV